MAVAIITAPIIKNKNWGHCQRDNLYCRHLEKTFNSSKTDLKPIHILYHIFHLKTKRKYAKLWNTGRRIPVVCMLWEHADWVQFPAPRRGCSTVVVLEFSKLATRVRSPSPAHQDTFRVNLFHLPFIWGIFGRF